jgi:hypothetical protein
MKGWKEKTGWGEKVLAWKLESISHKLDTLPLTPRRQVVI